MLNDGIEVAKTPYYEDDAAMSTMMTEKNGSLMKMTFNGLTKEQLTIKMTTDVKRTLQPIYEDAATEYDEVLANYM